MGHGVADNQHVSLLEQVRIWPPKPKRRHINLKLGVPRLVEAGSGHTFIRLQALRPLAGIHCCPSRGHTGARTSISNPLPGPDTHVWIGVTSRVAYAGEKIAYSSMGDIQKNVYA